MFLHDQLALDTQFPPAGLREMGTAGSRDSDRGPPLWKLPDQSGSFDPSPHRSMNSTNLSLGNAERRPPYAYDAGQAHVDRLQARSLTLAKRPMPPNHGVAATPNHSNFPSARAS